MRRQAPLILGAGPAGCAAAIVLARAGTPPLMIDRDERARDQLCGGFLSWRTVEQLAGLGIDCAALGAQQIDVLRLFDASGRMAQTRLPHPARALSRFTLDNAMRDAALAHGATLVVEQIRGIGNGKVLGNGREWDANSIFLATGKHDLRGLSRPRHDQDSALGLRLRLSPTPARGALLQGAIELHLFKGGYAGMVLQEDGSANVCLALRKSSLARHGSAPRDLLEALGHGNAPFAERLGDEWRSADVETIGAVPYGWIARHTSAGLFRLGDQAAVIPSLAGEGMSIAVASGIMAAECWQAYGSAGASHYQRALAAQVTPPVQIARAARGLVENNAGSRLALAVTRAAPGIVHALATRTRVDASASLAPASGAA